MYTTSWPVACQNLLPLSIAFQKGMASGKPIWDYDLMKVDYTPQPRVCPSS